MKTMINPNTNQSLRVIQHIITSNQWEFYVCQADTNRGTVYLCLVMGEYTEIGDVCLDEIKSHTISRTTNMNEVMPAQGWKWA